jgi:ethanolamine ammonia-lyase small subunit
MPEARTDFWDYLRNATSARIALGRVGDGLPTQRVLEFQLAHARARHAVHAKLNWASLQDELGAWNPLLVHSQAQNREAFLQRPDLGRKLTPQSGAELRRGVYDATIVIADGLSATAVNAQAGKLGRMLLECQDFSFAPPVMALQARVALGDAIAVAQGARMVVTLIGERPGLSACDSLGAYLTFDPKPDETSDAQRNCVSNIRPGGLRLEDAYRRILGIMFLARKLQLTGTKLKEDDALALMAPTKQD